MDSDRKIQEGTRPENIHNRIHQLVRGITAENLDIFFFGWYELQEDGRRLQKSKIKRYKKRVNKSITHSLRDCFI